jgi:hypothetical protein
MFDCGGQGIDQTGKDANMNDFADNYSVRKWLRSNRAMFRRGIRELAVLVLVAVPVSLVIEWTSTAADTRIPVGHVELLASEEYSLMGYEVWTANEQSDRSFLVIDRLPDYEEALWRGLLLGLIMGAWNVIRPGGSPGAKADAERLVSSGKEP